MLIDQALEVYREHLQKLGQNEPWMEHAGYTSSDAFAHAIFDTRVLQGLIKSEVEIQMTIDEVEDFTHMNHVDLPVFIDHPPILRES